MEFRCTLVFPLKSIRVCVCVCVCLLEVIEEKGRERGRKESDQTQTRVCVCVCDFDLSWSGYVLVLRRCSLRPGLLPGRREEKESTTFLAFHKPRQSCQNHVTDYRSHTIASFTKYVCSNPCREIYNLLIEA